MNLADLGDLATVGALLILVYVTAKPTVNRWATVKFLRAIYEAPIDDLLTGPLDGLQRKRRLARSWREFLRRCYQRLMTKAHQINYLRLHKACQTVRKEPDELVAFNAPRLLPQLTDTERELVVEAAVLSLNREKKMRERHLRRIHKGVVCAGGCGTPYGECRQDHNLVGGGGIEGGWFCPSNESCRTKPTGRHYCGMCYTEQTSMDPSRRTNPPYN